LASNIDERSAARRTRSTYATELLLEIVPNRQFAELVEGDQSSVFPTANARHSDR